MPKTPFSIALFALFALFLALAGLGGVFSKNVSPSTEQVWEVSTKNSTGLMQKVGSYSDGKSLWINGISNGELVSCDGINYEMIWKYTQKTGSVKERIIVQFANPTPPVEYAFNGFVPVGAVCTDSGRPEYVFVKADFDE